MNIEDLKKNVVKNLYSQKDTDKNRWAVFFLGSQLSVGDTKLYKYEGTARGRFEQNLMSNKYWWMLEIKGSAVSYDEIYADKIITLENIKKIVKELEDKGLLEIRQLGDRSPRFPHNIDKLDKEQADKFAKMLDAPDEEMCNLAINILEQMKQYER